MSNKAAIIEPPKESPFISGVPITVEDTMKEISDSDIIQLDGGEIGHIYTPDASLDSIIASARTLLQETKKSHDRLVDQFSYLEEARFSLQEAIIVAQEPIDIPTKATRAENLSIEIDLYKNTIAIAKASSQTPRETIKHDSDETPKTTSALQDFIQASKAKMKELTFAHMAVKETLEQSNSLTPSALSMLKTAWDEAIREAEETIKKNTSLPTNEVSSLYQEIKTSQDEYYHALLEFHTRETRTDRSHELIVN